MFIIMKSEKNHWHSVIIGGGQAGLATGYKPDFS
jgi:cation diffusion facilitator CzcD-associated flavoprotein CzcO